MSAFGRSLVYHIGMPQKSGNEVIEELKKEHLTCSCDGGSNWVGSEEDRQRSHLAGFDFHLTKPMALAELTKILDSL
jgi:DNA-binding response OmpR family regulator